MTADDRIVRIFKTLDQGAFIELADAIARPFAAEQHVVTLACRIGVAESGGVDDGPALMRRASLALAEAKTGDPGLVGTLDAGGVPDNLVQPTSLRRLDRELLRDALRVVKAFQQHVRGVFHLGD